jgi:hypothetical protein
MNPLGINFGFLILQCINFLLLLGWPVLSIVTILAIKKRQLADTAQAIWVLISLVPFLGALAFFLIQPGQPESSK